MLMSPAASIDFELEKKQKYTQEKIIRYKDKTKRSYYDLSALAIFVFIPIFVDSYINKLIQSTIILLIVLLKMLLIQKLFSTHQISEIIHSRFRNV